MFQFAKETKDMSDIEILNYYRNLYYAEPTNTEQGIVANAINGIFTLIKNQQAKIDELQGWDRLLIAEKHSLIKAEAYKDFANKLKSEIAERTSLSVEQDKNVIRMIDSLLNERLFGNQQ